MTRVSTKLDFFPFVAMPALDRFARAKARGNRISGKPNPIFSPNEVELLGNKSAKALDRVVDAIESINALTADSMGEIESF